MAFAKLSPEDIRKHKGASFTGITTVFWCYNNDGLIFLAKRSKNARDEHGRWDPGAGGLKHGQTLEENVRRELKNEPHMFDDSGWFALDELPSPLHSQFEMFLSRHGDKIGGYFSPCLRRIVGPES